MLELNQPNVEENHVKDVNEETFMDDVIEASKNSPIVVDFWAPWCGPCKTLGPTLEAEVKATNGKIKMVKIDIDQNQNLASQMRIQSIPAVFAFVDGQPIDGFMGAKAPSELKKRVYWKHLAVPNKTCLREGASPNLCVEILSQIQEEPRKY